MNNSIISLNSTPRLNEIIFLILFTRNFNLLQVYIYLKILYRVNFSYNNLRNYTISYGKPTKILHKKNTQTIVFWKENDCNFLNNSNTLVSQMLLLFLNSWNSHSSHIHYNYKKMFNIRLDNTFFFDVNLFSQFWLNGLTFIMNIFFFDIDYLLFGSYITKKEILAINWARNKTQLSVWKYYYPIFILKSTNFNHKVNFFFKKFSTSKFNLFFIIDTNYHFKNLYYFKKYQYFTIGPSEPSFNPWLLSLPLPVLVINDMTQFFFLNYIVSAGKSAHKIKWELKKNLWYII